MLWIASDNNVEWTGASDAKTAAYLNSATVTYVLKDSAGTTITSGTCDYVAASDGDYLGVIDAADVDALTEGTQYTLDLTLVQGNYNDFRRHVLTARYRNN